MSVDQNVEDNADCESQLAPLIARTAAITPASPRSESVWIMLSPIWQQTKPCTIRVRDKAAGRDRLYEGCNRNKGQHR